MNAPRHAGSLDPPEFSLVEFCQLVDFLLDIVSLVSFFFSLSVPYLFLNLCFLSLLFFYSVLYYVPPFFSTGFIATSILVSTFSHSPVFHSLFSHFHLSCFSLTFGSDIHLESLCSISLPLLNPVWGVMPTIRGSCQCITPLLFPSLCLCAVSTQAQKKLVISFFAKISICIISEMCFFFIRHFQTDEFGNP